MRVVSLLHYYTFANVHAFLNKPLVHFSMVTEYRNFRALVSQTLLDRFTSVELRSYAIGSFVVFQGALFKYYAVVPFQLLGCGLLADPNLNIWWSLLRFDLISDSKVSVDNLWEAISDH